ISPVSTCWVAAALPLAACRGMADNADGERRESMSQIHTDEPDADAAADEFRCPQCEARRITVSAVECWQCRRPLPEYRGPVPEGELQAWQDNPALISLGFLGLLVGMGLFAEAPALGCVLLAPAAGLAGLRGWVMSESWRRAGLPMTTVEKVGALFSSGGVIAAAGGAAVIVGVAFRLVAF